MPKYFFHHHSPKSTLRDETGCRFDTLEAAYLDAYRSMVEIGAELIKQQEDPSRDRIEITDGAGCILMELHFSDVFRGRRGSQIRSTLAHVALREQITRSRQLKSQLRELCETAQLSVANARAMLERARSIV